MLCFLDEITKWLDEGSPVNIFYLDFQKAFDIDWIEQWLTDRRQRVVVDGEVSHWKSVLNGVPQ